MRAAFGLITLLVALAVVALLVSRQGRSVSTQLPVVSGEAHGESSTGTAPEAGNVRAQAQQRQQQVLDDVQRAMQQGAATRREAEE